jgi:hypothetical protein
MIKDSLSLGGDYKKLLAKNTTEEWTATGDSDVLTVNVNLIGQGLLDNRETRDILLRWREAITAPVDDKLKWRQRRNFKNIDQIFTGFTQAHLLSALMAALFGGVLEVVKGSDETPEVLLLKAPDGQVADLARVEIEIPQLPSFSSWPNILVAFERMVLGIDTESDFKGTIVEKMFEYRPPILQGDSKATIPHVVRTMLSMRAAQLDGLKRAATSANYGEGAIRMLTNAIDFWETGIVRAFDFEVPGGFYRSLDAAMRDREPNFSWR